MNEPIPQIVHESWHSHLQPLFDDPKMVKIKTEVLANCLFYPEPKDIFRVFAMPIDRIRIVVIGQDPYIKGEAIGLAFAVSERTPIPKSLQIIREEVRVNQIGQPKDMNMNAPRWQTLQHWVDQGVFLLNSALTVERGRSASHLGIWSWFTKAVVTIISRQAKPVWLLWGAKAQAYEAFIDNRADSTVAAFDRKLELPLDANYMLKAPHPAAEIYPDGNKRATFTGCNHFNLCNEILQSKQQLLINW